MIIFVEMILVMQLCFFFFAHQNLKCRTRGTPLNTPNSMATNITTDYCTIVHENKNFTSHILNGLKTMYI
jgi:hypothetical protein